MRQTRRRALIGAAAIALVACGGIAGWQVVKYRADQAFIADQYAQLEADKAALTEEAPPAFDERDAWEECSQQWQVGSDARRFREIDSLTVDGSIEATDGLWTVYGTAKGTNGRRDIEQNISCTVLLDDDEWIVSLS